MVKIGRNSPCPCGSGKKYKHCHGSLALKAVPKAMGVSHIIEIARMRQEARRIEIERQFGKGRPPIALESHGYKIVAVGNEIHWSEKWKTFPDFLMDYFKKVLGPEWGKAQLTKGQKSWSPIFEWYAQTCEYQKEALTDGHQSTVSRAELLKALGKLAPSIECFKARLAFQSFEVVRQQNVSLWC